MIYCYCFGRSLEQISYVSVRKDPPLPDLPLLPLALLDRFALLVCEQSGF